MSIFFKGSIPYAFNLKTNEHVPERMIKRINKATVSMIENGLQQFYKSFGIFLEEFMREKLNRMHNDDDAAALTMGQLKIPLIIYFILLSMASILLAIEIIVHRVNKWRSRQRISNRRMANQQPVIV